jgi:hypothetical protein
MKFLENRRIRKIEKSVTKIMILELQTGPLPGPFAYGGYYLGGPIESHSKEEIEQWEKEGIERRERGEL